MKRKRIVVFGLLILGVVFNQAFSQDALKKYTSEDTVYVSADKDPRIAEFNSIAIKMPLTMQKTPATVQAITQSTLEDQNSMVLSDAMENISGVNPQSGYGTHDYFMIRGFDTLENGLMLTDGTIEPEAIIHNMYNIERVEVLKGPGAFLYGGNPLSGTINLVRKMAQYQNFANATVSGGSFNTMRGVADVNVSNNKDLAFRFNGVYQQSDMYRDDKESSVYGINPAFSWKPALQSQLDVNYEYLNSQYSPDAGLPLLLNTNTYQLDALADVPRDRSYQTPFDESEQIMQRLKIHYTHTFNDHLKLSNRFFYTDLKWDSQGAMVNGAYPSFNQATMSLVTVVNRSMQILDDHQKITGNQFELTFSKEFGKTQYQLLTGIEAHHFTDVYTIDVVNSLPFIDLYNPVETFNGDFSNAYRYQQGDAVTNTVAPYIMNALTLPQGFNFMAGGRFDNATYKDDLNSVDKTYKQFSPMVGAGYSPFKSTYLYANAGQAFSTPSVRLMGALDPEESFQVEAGIKQSFLKGKIKSSLAVYSLEKKNIAVPDRTGLTKQAGSQKSQGLEFEVTAQMTKHCASIFTYAYTDAEMTDYSEMLIVGYDEIGYPQYMYTDRSGNKATFAPEHILNFWHWREFGAFEIGFGVRYVSEQFIYYDNLFKIDSYYTLNAMASYSFKNLKWFINAKNITDSEYELSGFSGYSVIPAAPFAIYSGIRFNLDSL